MLRTIIFCAVVCVCHNSNAQNPSAIEKARFQDAWLAALVQFDGNREKIAEEYAVIIETDFAGQRKSFNGNVLLFNRRFLLRHSERKELFAAATDNDPDQSEWTEVWRFTWLDLEKVSDSLEPQQILKTLSKSPPNPEIFSKFKKYLLK